MSSEAISASHIGYLCRSSKQAIVRHPQSTRFEVQNMALFAEARTTNASENFRGIMTGEIQRIQTDMGEFGICDFSAIRTPGVYRVVCLESGACTYQFNISDGAYHRLLDLFLDFIHSWRAGDTSNPLRRASTRDDGVRDDTHAQWHVQGGWYDAGDLRQWMVHSNLVMLGMLDIHERLALTRHAFPSAPAFPSDWLSEVAWGVSFICDMQDPETGMFFEDVGGGTERTATEGIQWWYENHAGCTANNSDNRFTDNLTGTGDERRIRSHYNPIVQYTNLAILARAYSALVPCDPISAQRARHSLWAGWRHVEEGRGEAGEGRDWTSVRSWRLGAMLELWRAGLIVAPPAIESAVDDLLANYDSALGWWRNAQSSSEPYRGILHSAQPLIVLSRYLELAATPDSPRLAQVRSLLEQTLERYILPMSQTNPFGFMPFGLFHYQQSTQDHYRPWNDALSYRFCMLVHHPQQVNHGLSGHWMSWAHGLASLAQVLNSALCRRLAWAQIEWLTGNNHRDVSFISGIGYHNPMPHSRYFGTAVGGFMNGFRGTAEDLPFVDLERNAEWNSTEYWNTPLSNSLMALARLLPSTVAEVHKLGANSPA